MIDKKIKYVYFDLDGTIAQKDGKISDENIRAIKYLQSNGIKVGIATGRTIQTMQEEIDKIQPNLPIITANGSAILSKNKSILNETFLSYDSWIVIDTLIDFGFSFIIYTKNGIYTNNENNVFFRRLFDRVSKYDDKYKNFELEEVKNIAWLKRKKTYKILVSFDSEYEKEMLISKLSEINSIDCFASSGNVLEICPKNVSKGNAIKTISSAMEININEMIVFGDNDNDVSMFKLVNNSVCLLNGSEEAKKFAKFITELDCENNGFANFVFKYF